jgi:hypothetical protein
VCLVPLPLVPSVHHLLCQTPPSPPTPPPPFAPTPSPCACPEPMPWTDALQEVARCMKGWPVHWGWVAARGARQVRATAAHTVHLQHAMLSLREPLNDVITHFASCSNWVTCACHVSRTPYHCGIVRVCRASGSSATKSSRLSLLTMALSLQV